MVVAGLMTKLPWSFVRETGLGMMLTTGGCAFGPQEDRKRIRGRHSATTVAPAGTRCLKDCLCIDAEIKNRTKQTAGESTNRDALFQGCLKENKDAGLSLREMVTLPNEGISGT
jgi:hypothetical protein